MGDAISNVYRNYATFTGRATRSEYWWFTLFMVIVYVVFLGFGSTDDISVLGGIGLLILLASIIPSIAVTVRRLHDTGRSGWWYLINFVPFIGWIWLIVLTCMESAPDNEYGPRPGGSSSTPAAPTTLSAPPTQTPPSNQGPFI